MEKPQINYDDFSKIELKVATIKDVVPHPNADKLYIVTIDLGGSIRQIVAGIRLFYESEALKGRQVVVVANLAPAVIRGVESQGMLLAATDASGISVLSPDRAVLDGSGVK